MSQNYYSHNNVKIPLYPPTTTRMETDYHTQETQPSAPIQAHQPYPTSTKIVYLTKNLEMGRRPQPMECPHCHENILTEREYTAGCRAWTSCFVLGAIGCVLCCWIPFTMKSCQNVEHFCPKCLAYIGSYKR